VKDKRAVLSLAVAVVAALVWWSQSSGGSENRPANPGATTAVAPSLSPGGTDPQSGLPSVAVAALPSQARQTLDRIDSGGPFRYDQDGVTFGNFEAILPQRARGYYKEYTVETPGSPDRGARRIVAGDGGDFYYTDDHYNSFARIIR
jgi:ribonuclease T1